MQIVQNIDIETLIELLKSIEENHWVLVEWNPDIEFGIQPSICAVTKQHIEVFRDWVIENEEFIWTNDMVSTNHSVIKSAIEILEELTFYYDPNMICLYQKLHERIQHLKSIKFLGTAYNFQKFIEDICAEEECTEPSCDEEDVCETSQENVDNEEDIEEEPLDLKVDESSEMIDPIDLVCIQPFIIKNSN